MKTVTYQAVDTKTAANILGISTSYLEKLRLYQPEKSPPIIRIGRAVRYPLDSLQEWANSRLEGGEHVSRF